MPSVNGRLMLVFFGPMGRRLCPFLVWLQRRLDRAFLSVPVAAAAARYRHGSDHRSQESRPGRLEHQHGFAE